MPVYESMFYNEAYTRINNTDVKIDPAVLAQHIRLYFLTPKESREAYAREVLKHNPLVTFIAYVLYNTADRSVNSEPWGNQPYRKGEAVAVQAADPTVMMMYPGTTNPIVKGDGSGQPQWLVNYTHDTHRTILKRHMNEVLARAPFFEYVGFDDYSTRAYNFQAPQPEYSSEQFGASRSPEYWAAFLANAEYNRKWIEETGRGHAANMNSPTDSAMITRFVDSMATIAPPLNGLPSIIMMEYFITDSGGNNNTTNARTGITRAKSIKDQGARLLATIHLNPFTVNAQRASNGATYRQFMYNMHALMLVHKETDYVRVAHEYKYFDHIKEVEEFPASLGAALEEDYTELNGVYRRRFENGTVVVNTNTHEGYVEDAPIVVNTPVREGRLAIVGAQWLNFRKEHSTTSMIITEAYNGAKIRQYKDIHVEGDITWSNVDIQINGVWTNGWLAIFGGTGRFKWHATILPDITVFD